MSIQLPIVLHSNLLEIPDERHSTRHTLFELMNSLLVDPYAENTTPPRSNVQFGLVMADSRLDDELSVATIEFTDSPRWLRCLARDPNGFPKKTTYGTLWNMTAVSTTVQDEDGKTEFIRAVIRGVDRANLFYPEMLAEFEDVDVNIQDKMGRTALHWASERGLSNMVRLCLSVPDCDTGLKDNDGRTAFDLSRGGGAGAESIQTLFYSSIVDMEPRDPQSALLRALTITSEPNENKAIFPGESMFDPIRDRNSPLVMALIDRQVDLTTRDGNGNTALHLAAGQAGNAEIVRRLLVAGADINSIGNCIPGRLLQAAADVNGIGAGGATPLHQATAIADQEMMRVLLRWTDDRTVHDADGTTGSEHAVRDAYGGLGRLVEHQEAPAPENDAGDSSAICEVQVPEESFGSELEEVTVLDKNVQNYLLLRFEKLNEQEQVTALLLAATEGDLGSLQVLLEMGVDKEATGHKRRTALAQASANGQNLAVKTLLVAGANIEASSIGEAIDIFFAKSSTFTGGATALTIASANGHNLVVKTLLAAGADIESSQIHDTALANASRYGQTLVVKTLITAGANIEASINDGTPVILAACNGHNETVKTLLAAGADIEASTAGLTVLAWASVKGQNEVVETLLAAGANVEATHWKGTSLVWASWAGQNDVVKILLAAGADIEATNGKGTALQWAVKRGQGNVVATLRAAGARRDTATLAYAAVRRLWIN